VPCNADDTLARGWEFSLGALLAIAIPYLRIPAALRILMGWVGLFAILSCGILLQVSRVFPGYAALWPTLAAVFIIVAGTTGSRFGADRLLASKPLVYFGGISYGIYLWHFPILTFWRQYAQPHQLGNRAGITILVAAVGLAALSTRFIENRVREPRGASSARGRPFAFAAACLAPVVVGLGVWSSWYLVVKHPHRVASMLQQLNYPGAMARKAGFHYQGGLGVDVIPGPLQVADDREMLVEPGCNTEPQATMPALCRVAGGEKGFTLAVLGGSHSSQWLPALQMIAERAGWRVISFTKSDCPFYLGQSVTGDEVRSCHEWNKNVLQAVLQMRPDAVFTTATRYNEDAADEFVPDHHRHGNCLLGPGVPVVNVHVGSADAGAENFNEAVVDAAFGDRHLVEPQADFAVLFHERFHGFLHRRSSSWSVILEVHSARVHPPLDQAKRNGGAGDDPPPQFEAGLASRSRDRLAGPAGNTGFGEQIALVVIEEIHGNVFVLWHGRLELVHSNFV